MFCLLAEQGELARRYEGDDKGETPDEEQLRAAVMPYDVIAMRQSVLEALMRGYKRDVPEEETALGLAELQKKRTAKRSTQTTSASEPDTVHSDSRAANSSAV